MCEPTTLAVAMMAISAAGSVVQHNEQKKAARDQTNMINDGYGIQTQRGP